MKKGKLKMRQSLGKRGDKVVQEHRTGREKAERDRSAASQGGEWVT
jgi:hypothetical protein